MSLNLYWRTTLSKREEILRIAGLELQTRGVSGLSFRELAARLDIKSSSVHYYFPQKDDLIEALARDYKEQTFAELLRRTESLKQGKPRLLALLELIQEKLERRICTAGILAAESASISANARTAVAEFFTALNDWIQSELLAMGKETAESKTLAAMIMTSIEGSLIVDSLDADQAAYILHLRDFVAGL